MQLDKDKTDILKKIGIGVAIVGIAAISWKLGYNRGQVDLVLSGHVDMGSF